MNQNQFDIGERYYFKLHQGRGRPFIGTVSKVGRNKLTMETRTGGTMDVPFDAVIEPFDPATRPARRSAATTTASNGRPKASETFQRATGSAGRRTGRASAQPVDRVKRAEELISAMNVILDDFRALVNTTDS